MWKLLIPLFGVIIATGCSTPHYIYVPARVNAPLLQEKNEFQVDGSISATKGFDASAAIFLFIFRLAFISGF